jgi:hypothetical protein
MNATLISAQINGKLLSKTQTAELVKTEETAELVKLVVLEAGVSNNLTWVSVNSNTSMSADNGYVTVNDLSRIVMILPSITPASASRIAIENRGIAGFQIQQNDLQSVIAGNRKTTVGVQGLINSLDYGDFIEMEYVLGSWVITKLIGNIEIL